jgi:hypothetical protein
MTVNDTVLLILPCQEGKPYAKRYLILGHSTVQFFQDCAFQLIVSVPRLNSSVIACTGCLPLQPRVELSLVCK